DRRIFGRRMAVPHCRGNNYALYPVLREAVAVAHAEGADKLCGQPCLFAGLEVIPDDRGILRRVKRLIAPFVPRAHAAAAPFGRLVENIEDMVVLLHHTGFLIRAYLAVKFTAF